MAILHCTVRSNVLQMDTPLVVFFPDDRDGKSPRPEKVVYLLHGYGRGSDQWVRETTAEKDCSKYGFVGICPDVGHSFYTDLKYGQSYFTYITEELPAIVKRIFGLNPSRENTFIAGLSMGGYGAMKAVLNYPDQYAAAGSFAGALDIHMLQQYMQNNPLEIAEMVATFGETGSIPPEANLHELMETLKSRVNTNLPTLYQCVGRQDYLYPLNRSFLKKAAEEQIPVLYEEWDGEHNYLFWSKALTRCLALFSEGNLPE